MNKYKCYFDGSINKNPGGDMGIGAIIYLNNEVMWKKSYLVKAKPDNTNNVAETLALIEILDFFVENQLTREHIDIFGDSQLVIYQATGKYKIKSGHHKKNAEYARSLIIDFTNLSIKWIPRLDNTIADELSGLSR